MTQPRQHHELGPQAVAILAAGASIYGARIIAAIVRIAKGGRK